MSYGALAATVASLRIYHGRSINYLYANTKFVFRNLVRRSMGFTEDERNISLAIIHDYSWEATIGCRDIGSASDCVVLAIVPGHLSW